MRRETFSLGYLRWPALHGHALCFVADGSVWLQSDRDQPAQRLTERTLQAREPSRSPCGRWLAFSGLQGGARELWMLDLHNGGARVLSAEALPMRVCGWHPDGRVLVAWRGLLRPVLWTLRLVAPDGGTTEDLPLHDASDACFVSPTRLIFVRGGLLDEHVRRYRGGAMRRLWSLDLDSEAEARPLPLPTQAAHAEAWAPRFDGKRIFFLCDATGLPALWSAAPDGAGAAPWLTLPNEAIDSYAVHPGGVVHARDGRLYSWRDPAPLSLELTGDWPGRRPHWDAQPLRRLEAVLPHPKAGALLRCRGRLWWLPPPGTGADTSAEPAALPWPGGRASAMAWAPDGRSAYAVSDACGEPEIWWLRSQSAPRRLTHDGQAERTGLWPSPCGHWLLHADAHLGLAVLNLQRLAATESVVEGSACLATPPGPVSGPVADAAWAPDGLAFVVARPVGPNERMRLEHWRHDGDQFVFVGFVGDLAYPCFSPAWSACGRWVFYLCARHFEAPDPHPWGDRNTGQAFSRRVRVDAQAMADGAVWPWAAAAEDAATAMGFRPAPASISAGIRREVPLPADAHERLVVSPRGMVSWVRQPRGNAPAAGGLWRLDFGVAATARSLPRAWSLFEQVGEVALVRPAEGGNDASLLWLQAGTAAEDTTRPALAPGWAVPVNPPAEWDQHLRDAWRYRRERFFDAARHASEGMLPLVRAQSALARVTERSEVDAVLADLLSGLSTLHTFVDPPPLPASDAAAFLGLHAEPAGGALRITRLLTGSHSDPAAQGPAAAAGLREGDLLMAIGGQPLDALRDGAMAASRWLAGTAGRRIALTVQRAAPEGSEDSTPTLLSVTVQPHGIAADLSLRHADHVRRTRARVAEASGGTIGYLHLTAMRQADLERFVRDAWADPNWRGLVLDLRGNRGGNIDSWLIEKLQRQPWAWWSRRHGPPSPNPPGGLPAPLAVLIDSHTYSDGETLAAGLQRLGRGRLFGMRSSGAGVWLNRDPNLLDGGGVAVGEFGQFDDHGWLIEGRGVEPDVVVDIDPRAVAGGQDAVLARSLRWLEHRIANAPEPPSVPGHSPDTAPDKPITEQKAVA